MAVCLLGCLARPPSLLGWRPSLLGARPSLLGWRPLLLGGGHRYWMVFQKMSERERDMFFVSAGYIVDAPRDNAKDTKTVSCKTEN